MSSGKVTARVNQEAMEVPSTPQGRTILLVEDDPDIRDGMASVLHRFGYQVLVACNGLEAIDVLHRADPPTLIVLDWMMPVMSGPELMERLGADPVLSGVPVLVVSAVDRAGTMANAGQIAAVLRKPVRMRTLVDVVDRLCGLPRRPDGMVTGAFPQVSPPPLRVGSPTVVIKRPKPA